MSKKFLPVLLLLASFSTFFFACTKESDNKYGTERSRGYYPLEIGRYVVYDVDSIIWDDYTQVKTTLNYQMRYTVADSFFDNANRKSYRIDVHLRRSDSLPWNTHRVINVTPTNTGLEYTEANLRFLKLIFPVANNMEWKGNAMIPSGDQAYQYFQNWTYRYSDHEKPFNNGKVLFDNTITVNQADEKLNDPETMPDSYAFLTFAKEVYGYDIGMVYREITHWIYDPKPGGPKYRRGYSVVMRAVDHN